MLQRRFSSRQWGEACVFVTPLQSQTQQTWTSSLFEAGRDKTLHTHNPVCFLFLSSTVRGTGSAVRSLFCHGGTTQHKQSLRDFLLIYSEHRSLRSSMLLKEHVNKFTAPWDLKFIFPAIISRFFYFFIIACHSSGFYSFYIQHIKEDILIFNITNIVSRHETVSKSISL